MQMHDSSIRVIHNMARSGGTVIGKCLGCMDRILLLSEIHPMDVRFHNPLQQACDWFTLFSANEIDKWRSGSQDLDFNEVIGLIRERAASRDQHLVFRDWSHIDFTGLPFLQQPTYTLTLADTLRQQHELLSVFTVRHPLDQWISLNKLTMFYHMPRPVPQA